MILVFHIVSLPSCRSLEPRLYTRDTVSRLGESLKKSDRYTSVFWGLFGLYIAFEGYQLKTGTLRNPKSGFFIFWLGIILFGLSVFLFVKSFAHSKAGEVGEQKDLGWLKGIILMSGLLVYVIAFKWLGFLLSTFLLLLFLFKALQPQRWRVALTLAVAAIVFSYVIFGVLLELRFPEGVLKSVLDWF